MLPDPAGGDAREATLTLGDTDVRYKGYLASVRVAIDRSWLWKEAIMAAGRGGRVLVRFTLEAEGRVADVEVSETSGSPILDREATQTVARAPFPPFPSHWTIERLNLFAQFSYRLE
jgi:TonB family protein